jgi:hypothetical protein
MPFEEAMKRAGSFQALVPHLRERRILARCHELRTWPELEVESGPGEIPPDWWDEARIDPATGRVILKKPDIRVHIRNISSKGDLPGQLVVHPGREVCALGIELERSPVATLFPAATVPGSRHAGGRDPDNDWEGAARHVSDWVMAQRPLPRRKDGKPNTARAVELMTEWFKENQPPAPERESIYRWLRQNPQPEWWL